MALNAKNIKSENKFERPPALEAGSYPARIVQIISLGLQAQRDFKGQKKTPIQKLMVTYELTDEFILDEDGKELPDKPRWVSEDFGLHSLDSDMAKSTKRMVALDTGGEADGDWAKLIGKACMVNLICNPSTKDGKTTIYNNVAGVSAMRAKDEAKLPDLVNEAKLFDFDEPDVNIFSSLSSYVQGLITDGLEFEGSALDKALDGRTQEDEAEPRAKSEDKSTSEEDW